MKRFIVTAVGIGMAIPLWVSDAAANSTLRVTANACTVYPDFKVTPPESMLLGRLVVSDDTGVLHQEENVVATRTGEHPFGCLMQFDIHFTDVLLEALLSEELVVELGICGEMRKDTLYPSGAGSCTFADNAATVVDEPINTLLDDVVAFALASYEAECPAGSALKRVDLDGVPGFVCTAEFALDTELASEAAARVAGDAALQSNLNAEIGARGAGDAALQSALAAEAAARTAGDMHAGDVAGSNTNLQIQPHTVGAGEVNSGQVQLRVSSACPPGSSIRMITETGAVVCETDDVGSSLSRNVPLYRSTTDYCDTHTGDVTTWGGCNYTHCCGFICFDSCTDHYDYTFIGWSVQ